MDQFWIYVIIAIIYGISSLLKKKTPDESDSEPQDRQYEEPRKSQKQLTFEELLKEITEGKNVEKPVSRPVQPVQTYVDYDDDLKDEEEEVDEVVRYDTRRDDQVVLAYEEAKRMAFERPSLEETMKLEDTKMKFGRFKEFEQVERRDLLKEYLIDFNDPGQWKKAVVMSEILKPKF